MRKKNMNQDFVSHKNILCRKRQNRFDWIEALFKYCLFIVSPVAFHLQIQGDGQSPTSRVYLQSKSNCSLHPDFGVIQALLIQPTPEPITMHLHGGPLNIVLLNHFKTKLSLIALFCLNKQSKFPARLHTTQGC